MVGTFCDLKYSTWNIDLTEFKNTTNFDVELDAALDITKGIQPKPSIGPAVTTNLHTVERFSSFFKLLKLITPSLNEQFKMLEFSNTRQIARVWANRMYKNSQGGPHYHRGGKYVLILYYTVPDDSADLILIDSKYKDIDNLTNESIPESDRRHIKVSEGMCILHDGEILHSVSEHLSDIPRDVVVFEFKK